MDLVPAALRHGPQPQQGKFENPFLAFVLVPVVHAMRGDERVAEILDETSVQRVA